MAVASLGIPKSYQRLGNFPLDDSTVFDTVVARNAMVEGVRYIGMTSYVKETGELYVLKGGLTNDCWVALSTSDTTGTNIKSYVVKSDAIVTGNIVRVINGNEIAIADTVNYDGVIGVALDDGVLDESIRVQDSGEVTILSDNDLVVGKQCFLGQNGKTVQSISDLPVILPLGIAVETNKITLNINNNEVIVVQ